MWTRRDCLKAGLGATMAGLWTSTVRGRVDAPEPIGRIYFYGSTIDGRADSRGIFAVDPQRQTWANVTADGGISSRVSPDGRTLAFEKDGGIWTLDLQVAGEAVRIAELVGRPIWSGDGKELVVSGAGSKPAAGLRSETWRMKADGTDRVKLPIPETDRVVDWSPDGQWFLVVSTRLPEKPEPEDTAKFPVYAVHPDGTGDHLLIATPNPGSDGFRFSPAGRVLYGRLMKPNDPTSHHVDLWSVEPDGKDRRRFLSGNDDTSLMWACTSPDGRFQAVQSRERVLRPDGTDGARTRIVVYGPDGKIDRRLDLPAIGFYHLTDWR